MTAKIPFHHLKSDKLPPGQFTSLRRYQTDSGLNEPAGKHFICRLDDASLRSLSEKSSHWSVAWSDLMMTMFILFLSLFVYQAAHKDFLVSDKAEVLGGETQAATQMAAPDETAFPFVAIKPAAPLMTAGTIRKVEPVTIKDVDLDRFFSSLEVEKTLAELARETPVIATKPVKKPEEHIPVAQSSDTPEKPVQPVQPNPQTPETINPQPQHRIELRETEQPLQIAAEEPAESVIQPRPLRINPDAERSVNELFTQSRETLDNYNLADFASIDLVPDKAVRIVLTGDLLFNVGEASLSERAVNSLEKIAAAISTTAHRIHIEGHTDDLPIAAGRYANNWELSMARAKAVAVFLIEDMGMDPDQFVISGYSSYQPIVPNTTSENRAANRRVEIVVAQNPEQPKIATLEHSAALYR
ncbi:OmpA/MotB family protein [Desulfopila inferna]|uniref:OmpA/MotB family protein n=1 Tax=Desulfopila inferna TaxID=468528 RepID=UPI0019659312|nr:flagellar motor protein MotB [Desulfopila inferna]MBM9605890.1 OmpA family protein [Desulfopila inferna]